MTDPRGPSPTPVRSQRLIAALVVALALITGLVLGVAVDRGILLRNRGPLAGHPGFGMRPGGRRVGAGGPPERMRQRFATDLGLSASQMTQIDSIMSQQMARRRALDDSMGARMRTLMDSTRAAVDRVLTPDQRQKLAALRARRDSARGSRPPRG
jgi:Spy/CpxP family protein refolding chaperone